jgi:Skp family chaperone for outer membrane proteins
MIVAALTLALTSSAFAQAAQPPAGAKPPAQPPAQPPAATQPAPKPAAPPVPFPQDAKIAFIDINQIAGSSAAGKEATKKLTALDEKMRGEITEKNKQLQAAQTKLNTATTVLSDSARNSLEKEISKMQLDIQYAQQNYQSEMQSLQNDLQGEFQKRLIPVIEEVAKEKGLHAVFSIADSGAAYVHPGLNISEEVIKRLDAKK